MGLFLLIALSARLGQIRVAGISLGTSAVVFVALGFGHFGLSLPSGLGSFGLVLFIYAVGLEAGPGFFRAFVSSGRALAQLSVVIVGVGAAVAVALAFAFEVPAPVAAGLLAGALTSTPGLASASQAVASAGGDPNLVTVAYGIAYPLGVIGVVAFVQIVPRFVRAEPEAPVGRRPPIEQIMVAVRNPAVLGRQLSELRALDPVNCQVTRWLKDGRLVPLPRDYRLAEGDMLLVVADADDAELAVTLLGERSDATISLDTERERAQVVITAPALFGKALRDLNLPAEYGITLSRVQRHDVTFVPSGDLQLRPGDQVFAVGAPAAIERFMAMAGHRARALYETDLASFAIGLLFGLLLGLTPVLLPGGGQFSLGLAGGPLIAGLALGHFGRIGSITGYVPRAARLLMTELGLALFLAEAGTSAGKGLAATLEEQGLGLLLMGAAITASSLCGGFVVGRRWMRLGLLPALGGLCGGMTSTPGIGALTSRFDAEAAVSSYAAAYPVALIMMGAFAQLLVTVLG